MQSVWSTVTKARLWRNLTHNNGHSRARYTFSSALCTNSLGWIRRAHSTSAITVESQPKTHNAASEASLARLSSRYRSLTSAQLSRAAAQAVRACVPRDALFILNSVHGSTFPAHHPLTDGTPRERLIKFGQPISPRLAAHSFLHLLIRRGEAGTASRYAELMMQQGIRIRTSTFQSMLESLCNGKPSRILANVKNAVHRGKAASQIPFHSKHSSIFAARHILNCAREAGQQRTHRMYETLISASLMQGELVVGTLLFVLVVKDWQAYKARGDGDVDPAGSSDTRNDHANEVSPKPPYPTHRMFTSITNTLKTCLSGELDRHAENHLAEPLQALAHLVELAEDGDLHSGAISTMIATLYTCPKIKQRVRVRLKNQEVFTEAYNYFHTFLRKVILSLHDPTILQLPALDRRAYNALLHYSLRHLLSPTLASQVLNHMCTHIEPNASTFNILLRSGTLLRRMDMTESVLTVLRRSSDIQALLSTTSSEEGSEQGYPSAKRPPSLHPTSKGLSDPAIRRLHDEDFSLPLTMISQTNNIEADIATMTSFIMHLTSIGRPHLVASLLFKILPELSIVDHPSWGDCTSEEIQRLRRETQHSVCIRKAIQLGPHFFAALLNALRKAGRTGLAERVWMLAQEAERASWHAGGDIQPWCLTIHAYTAIIRCYAEEVRRFRKRGGAIEDTHNWQPRIASPWVRGWARFILKSQRHEYQIHRHDAGKETIALLARTMRSGIRQALESYVELGKVDDMTYMRIHRMLPVPDARFFNALLRVFRLPTPRKNPAWYERSVRMSMNKFLQSGIMPRHWTLLLQEVAEMMIKGGFSIPKSYQPLLVGPLTKSPQNKHAGRLPVLYRGPYCYPRPSRRLNMFNAHYLHTRKTKGLPLQRRGMCSVTDGRRIINDPTARRTPSLTVYRRAHITHGIS